MTLADFMIGPVLKPADMPKLKNGTAVLVEVNDAWRPELPATRTIAVAKHGFTARGRRYDMGSTFFLAYSPLFSGQICVHLRGHYSYASHWVTCESFKDAMATMRLLTPVCAEQLKEDPEWIRLYSLAT